MQKAAKTVKATPANLVERLEKLMAEVKELTDAENESLKAKAAQSALGDVMDSVCGSIWCETFSNIC